MTPGVIDFRYRVRHPDLGQVDREVGSSCGEGNRHYAPAAGGTRMSSPTGPQGESWGPVFLVWDAVTAGDGQDERNRLARNSRHRRKPEAGERVHQRRAALPG